MERQSGAFLFAADMDDRRMDGYKTDWVEVFNVKKRKAISHFRMGSFVKLCSNKINQNFDVTIVPKSINMLPFSSFKIIINHQNNDP